MDPWGGCGGTDATLPQETISSCLSFPVKGQPPVQGRGEAGLSEHLGMTGRHPWGDHGLSDPHPGHCECLLACARLPLFSTGCTFPLAGLSLPSVLQSLCWSRTLLHDQPPIWTSPCSPDSESKQGRCHPGICLVSSTRPLCLRLIRCVTGAAGCRCLRWDLPAPCLPVLPALAFLPGRHAAEGLGFLTFLLYHLRSAGHVEVLCT